MWVQLLLQTVHFLKQSKSAANSIDNIITTFSLPNLLQHFSLFLCECLTKFAPGYSYIARIFSYWTRNQDFKGLFCSSVMLTVMLTVFQWATAHSTSLSHATPYLQVQNAKAFAHFPVPPQPPSLRRAGHPSSDIPNRCQQMVLSARPSSCHPLPAPTPCTAFYDLSPHLKPGPHQ